MKKTLIALFVLALAVPAGAQEQKITVTPTRIVLPTSGATPVACNAAAGSRTFVLQAAPSTREGNAFSHGVVNINYVYNAATAVTMTCSSSDDSGVNLFATQSCLTSSGVCSSSDASWSKAVSASKKWSWRVDLTGYTYVSCVLACTGGGATDTLYVTSYLTTK